MFLYPSFKTHWVLVFLLLGFGNAITAQVGIGTTNPQATLDVVGTYSPPVYNTSNLLNQNFDNLNSITQNNNTTGSCSTNGWTVVSSPPYICNNCQNKMLYINSAGSTCNQNATAIVNFNSNPTTTRIFISFDFRLVTNSATNDALIVYLKNNTANTSTLIFYATANLNGSASGYFTVPAGDSYSLHFQYTGTNANGATVDNAMATEQLLTTPGSYGFRMEDGSAQNGYVLTSDGSGNATWKPIPGAPFNKNSGDGMMQFTPSETPMEGTDSLFKTHDDPINTESQQQLILELQKAVREQKNIIEEQNKKIQAIENSLKALKVGDR